MALDYSKVIMVGRRWAVRGDDGELAMFETAYEAAVGSADSADNGNDGSDVETFDVFKVVDGERSKRASKHNLSADDADQFVADNPDNEYEIVSDAE